MQAIKDIFRIGKGPSSSHTIAPYRACDLFLKNHKDLDHYKVELYGSLALTGKGHKTDAIIKEVLGAKADVHFCLKLDEEPRNIMIIKGYQGEKLIDTWHVESLGGGSIKINEYDSGDEREYYPHDHFDDIKAYCKANDLLLIDYILKFEPDILDYLDHCIDMMCESVKRGISKEGLLNDRLGVFRSAKGLFLEGQKSNDPDLLRMAYAYAASEENADGDIVCTAPTLGSCGVAASFVYSSLYDGGYSKDMIKKALAVGGLFANIIKKNASISGALGGCQAEIGTACALTASAITYLEGGDIDTIEYAAEVGIEHHLGLTCDPVYGLVIIPCIERNAVAILRSYDAAKLAINIARLHNHKVSFDMVVGSMRETGKMISPEFKETSLGGLALAFKEED